MRRRSLAIVAAMALILGLWTAHTAAPARATALPAAHVTVVLTSQLSPADDNTPDATATEAANEANATATEQANETATEAANETATAQANATATEAANEANATATEAANEANATATEQTNEANETATAIPTATEQAKETATAAAHATATAQVAAQETTIAYAETYVAGLTASRDTATAIAQQTAAAATQAAAPTATERAQATATAMTQQTAVAQATATAQNSGNTNGNPPGNNGNDNGNPPGNNGNPPGNNGSPSPNGNTNGNPPGSNGSNSNGNGSAATNTPTSGQPLSYPTPPGPGPSISLSNLPAPPAQSVDVVVSSTGAMTTTAIPTAAASPAANRSSAPPANATATASAGMAGGASKTGAGQAHGNKSKTRAKRAQPRLQVKALSSLVRPGDVQRVAVSYVEEAVVQARVTLPGVAARSIFATTDSHGHLTLSVPISARVKLRGGHASGRVDVHAAEGPWKTLTRTSPVIHPGKPESIVVAFTPRTYVRAVVTIPGQKKALTLYNVTDAHGRVALGFTAPKSRALQAAHNKVALVVSALTRKRQADVVRTLHISDMIVNIAPGRIVNCVQTDTVGVTYYPNIPLKVILTFPHGHQIPVSARTDRSGRTRLLVHVSYVRARNPVHITVQALDGRARRHRAEKTAATVVLPSGCRR